MQASDSLYHRLFSDPVMIEQLVRGFLPAGIAALLDFTRLERVNAKFHAARGDRREGDVIWRVPTLAGEMVHIYLMLEFQATPERFMPVRVQVYSGLLWQQIIDVRALAPGGRLYGLAAAAAVGGLTLLDPHARRGRERRALAELEAAVSGTVLAAETANALHTAAIADGEVRDRRADLADDAHRLVAEHVAGLEEGAEHAVQVEV